MCTSSPHVRWLGFCILWAAAIQSVWLSRDPAFIILSLRIVQASNNTYILLIYWNLTCLEDSAFEMARLILIAILDTEYRKRTPFVFVNDKFIIIPVGVKLLTSYVVWVVQSPWLITAWIRLAALHYRDSGWQAVPPAVVSGGCSKPLRVPHETIGP